MAHPLSNFLDQADYGDIRKLAEAVMNFAKINNVPHKTVHFPYHETGVVLAQMQKESTLCDKGPQGRYMGLYTQRSENGNRDIVTLYVLESIPHTRRALAHCFKLVDGATELSFDDKYMGIDASFIPSEGSVSDTHSSRNPISATSTVKVTLDLNSLRHKMGNREYICRKVIPPGSYSLYKELITILKSRRNEIIAGNEVDVFVYSTGLFSAGVEILEHGEGIRIVTLTGAFRSQSSADSELKSLLTAFNDMLKDKVEFAVTEVFKILREDDVEKAHRQREQEIEAERRREARMLTEKDEANRNKGWLARLLSWRVH